MLALVLALVAVAWAGVARFGVFVGNNQGSAENPALYFAESDARKMAHLFTTVGGIPTENAVTLQGRDRGAVLDALVRVRAGIAQARARGEETVLVFYYSGHADETRMQLGRTWLTYDELSILLEKSGAEVRMAFLDACQSGAMTRAKGGQRVEGFVVELTERLDASGQVIITSSAADEASQESDEIGGSYFTHYLASALAGAADEDRDARVSLSEAYRYVHRETVFHTAATRAGTQHPTYEWDLAGTGDVVLAELRNSASTLIIPESLSGRFAIFDLQRRQFVAEIAVDGRSQELALAPGAYLIQTRYPTHLLTAQVQLREKGTVRVGPESFTAVEYEDDAAKGSIERQIRRASLPKLSLQVAVGGMSFADPAIEAQYFPSFPVAGVSGRWYWQAGRYRRGERFVSGDVSAGSGAGTLQLPNLAVGMPTRLHGGTVGVDAGFASARRLVQVGGGLRVAGVYLRREFPGQDLPDQSLVTIAPGWVAWLGLRPGQLELELALRAHYLPYRLDGQEAGTNFNQGLLMVGYRF